MDLQAAMLDDVEKNMDRANEKISKRNDEMKQLLEAVLYDCFFLFAFTHHLLSQSQKNTYKHTN